MVAVQIVLGGEEDSTSSEDEDEELVAIASPLHGRKAKVFNEFLDSVAFADQLDRVELETNFPRTVRAVKNRSAFRKHAGIFLNKVLKRGEEKGQIAIGMTLSVVRSVLLSKGVPVDAKTGKIVSKLHSAYNSSQEKLRWSKKEEKANIVSNIIENLDEMLDFLAISPNQDFRVFITSTVLPTLRSQHNISEVLKSALKFNDRDLEKARLMVRAVIALSSRCGFTIRQLWEMKIENFLPVHDCPNITEVEAVHAKNGIFINFQGSSVDLVTLIVPSKRIQSDPLVCLAQFLSSLSKEERAFPFRILASRRKGYYGRAPTSNLTRKFVLSLLVVCDMMFPLSDEFEGEDLKLKMIQNFPKAFLRSQGLLLRDVKAYLGMKAEPISYQDLCKRVAPYIAANRFSQDGTIAVEPAHPIWNTIECLSGSEWYNAVSEATLREANFQDGQPLAWSKNRSDREMGKLNQILNLEPSANTEYEGTQPEQTSDEEVVRKGRKRRKSTYSEKSDGSSEERKISWNSVQRELKKNRKKEKKNRKERKRKNEKKKKRKEEKEIRKGERKFSKLKIKIEDSEDIG